LQPDYLQAYVELGGMYDKAGRAEDAQNIFFKYEKKVYELAGKLENAETAVEDKIHILDVFSFVDDDRASAAILKAIADADPLVRERAIYLALEFELGDARPILEKLAENDPNQRVRLAAKEALAGLTGAPTGAAAPTIIGDPKKAGAAKN
jgi:HEAT repeat protein